MRSKQSTASSRIRAGLAKSFLELLRETLQKYHNRLIDATAIIQAMMQIREEMDADDERAKELGLEESELAVYDAITTNFGEVYEKESSRNLIHDIVVSIKRNLKVDWTEPHRSNVKAAAKVAIKNVLRRLGVKATDLDGSVSAVIEQDEALADSGMSSNVGRQESCAPGLALVSCERRGGLAQQRALGGGHPMGIEHFQAGARIGAFGRC